MYPETWLPGDPIWLDLSPGAALWDYPPAKAIFQRLCENSSRENFLNAKCGAELRI